MFPISRLRERAGVRARWWKRFARLPSPYPLSRAGEGKSARSGLALLDRRTAEVLRALPLSRFAGEGWGEGTLMEAFRALALTLPSPASGRGEKGRGREGNPCGGQVAFVARF